MALNYYQILGVGKSAPFQELKQAYYRQAKRCHPDLFRNSVEKTRQFQLLVQAFDVLSDSGKRMRYDRSLLSEEELIFADPLRSRAPVMDSEADDILEELVVGNDAPLETSLATLLLDWRKTEIFMQYREGRNHLDRGAFADAAFCFEAIVDQAPGNIVYRVCLARALAGRGRTAAALRHYRKALDIAGKRVPAQRLTAVRAEMELTRRRGSPWRRWLERLFPAKRAEPFEDEADRMIGQLNRSLTAAARQRLENRKDD